MLFGGSFFIVLVLGNHVASLRLSTSISIKMFSCCLGIRLKVIISHYFHNNTFQFELFCSMFSEYYVIPSLLFAMSFLLLYFQDALSCVTWAEGLSRTASLPPLGRHKFYLRSTSPGHWVCCCTFQFELLLLKMLCTKRRTPCGLMSSNLLLSTWLHPANQIGPTDNS